MLSKVSLPNKQERQQNHTVFREIGWVACFNYTSLKGYFFIHQFFFLSKYLISDELFEMSFHCPTVVVTTTIHVIVVFILCGLVGLLCTVGILSKPSRSNTTKRPLA